MRLRLILGFSLVILITLLAVSFFIQSSTQNELHAFLWRGGFTGWEELVAELENHYQRNDGWNEVNTVFESIEVEKENESGQGQGQGKNTANPQGGFGAIGNLFLLDIDQAVVYFAGAENIEALVDSGIIHTALEIVVEGELVGYLGSIGGSSVPNPNFETSLLEKLSAASWKAALFAAGLAIILAVGLAYLMNRPVQKLTRAATRTSEGDLTQRVQVKGKDEIAFLGKAFNDMAESLENMDQSRKALTADIAHELRTPLSVLRMNIEALQDGVYELSIDSLKPLDDQVHLLSRLVDDLRILSLTDVGELPVEFRATQISTLISNVANRFQNLVQKEQKRLTIAEHSALPEILADPYRIEQILVNLLQNAIRFTPENGEVIIGAELAGDTIVLWVKDSGPGIPEEALEKIFNRFYRVEDSRNKIIGGTGLGLAIASHLAQIHQGELIAENHPEGGAVFRLILPVQSKIGV